MKWRVAIVGCVVCSIAASFFCLSLNDPYWYVTGCLLGTSVIAYIAMLAWCVRRFFSRRGAVVAWEERHGISVQRTLMQTRIDRGELAPSRKKRMLVMLQLGRIETRLLFMLTLQCVLGTVVITGVFFLYWIALYT